MASSAPLLRAPLQARSVATRARLVDATVEALVEQGYAGTTTTEVAARAGVSQGALYKHFPNKRQLLAAGVAHVFDSLVREFRDAFARRRSRDVGAALELLARSFASPRLLAAFEVYTAARTDADLAAAVAPILAEHRDNLRREARRLFPDAPPRVLDPLVDTVMSAYQGAALGTLVAADPRAERKSRVLLARWVAQELEDV